MPINHGNDKNGHYFRWGTQGTKYYFNPQSTQSFNRAHDKALKQGVAIMYSQYQQN